VEQVDHVLEPRDVGVADDQQRRRGDRPDLVGRPTVEPRIQLVDLRHQPRPVLRTGCDPQIRLLPARSLERREGITHLLEHLGVQTVAAVGDATEPHHLSHDLGVQSGQFEGDGGPRGRSTSAVWPWPCSSTAITSWSSASLGSSAAKQLSMVPIAPCRSTIGAPAPWTSW
jgi:hypothetical protein